MRNRRGCALLQKCTCRVTGLRRYGCSTILYGDLEPVLRNQAIFSKQCPYDSCTTAAIVMCNRLQLSVRLACEMSDVRILTATDHSLKLVATVPLPKGGQHLRMSWVLGNDLRNGCSVTQKLCDMLKNPHNSIVTSAEHRSKCAVLNRQ